MSRETKLSGRQRGQGIFFFTIELTTSGIGNLTRLIHTLLNMVTQKPPKSLRKRARGRVRLLVWGTMSVMYVLDRCRRLWRPRPIPRPISYLVRQKESDACNSRRPSGL